MLTSPPILIFRLDRPINAGVRRLICTSMTIRRGGEREEGGVGERNEEGEGEGGGCDRGEGMGSLWEREEDERERGK